MSVNRREFLGYTGSCMAIVTAFGAKALKANNLSQQLSMVDLTQQHLKEGFWSADSLFLSAVKYLKESEEIVRLTRKNKIPIIIAVPNISVKKESNCASQGAKVKLNWARTTTIKVTRKPAKTIM